jgi:O-antigen/teichoic acid export membrane protein
MLRLRSARPSLVRALRLVVVPAGDDEGSADLAAVEPGAGRRVLSLHANAIALLSHIVISAAFGYLSWLFAARMIEPDAVGVSAAAVSAAILCSQFAVLGLATSVITFLPAQRRDPARLLNTFFSIVIVFGSLCGVVFVVIAVLLFDRLAVLGSNYTLALWFVGLVTFTTVLLLLDGTSVAIRRADFALARGVGAGAAKLGVLVVAWAASLLSAAAIVFAWFVSTLAVCLLGYRQIRSVYPDYRYRPRVHGRTVRNALRNGLANHLLNLTKFAPIFVIPLIVTETLSPSENAYWYGAWMVAFLVRFIPLATGQAAFAEITNGAVSLASGIRRSIWSATALALVPTLVVVALAEPILSLMGSSYAEAGATPLRLLVLGVIPQVAIELYVVTRRVMLRLTEPNIVFLLSGIASIIAAAYGAHVGGLIGVAIGWLAVDTAVGAWAALRVFQLVHASSSDSAV